MIKLKKFIIGLILSLLAVYPISAFACEECDNIIGLINLHLNQEPTEKTNFALVDFFAGEDRDCFREINLDNLVDMVSPCHPSGLRKRLPNDNSEYYRKLLLWTSKGGNIHELKHMGIFLDESSAEELVSFSVRLD